VAGEGAALADAVDLLVGAGLDVDAAGGGAEDADEVVLHAILDRRHTRLLRAAGARGGGAGVSGGVSGLGRRWRYWIVVF
jgi:hypothetical protein